MSEMQPGMKERLGEVRRRLSEAARGREVRLLAVSKTFPEEALEEACRLGLRAFGENYAQECCRKIDWFREHHPELGIEWHFIGPLQGNKTRMVAERVQWVETVDRERIARRLNDQRPADMPPLNVLLEVNIDGEATKSGVAPDEVEDLARAVAALPRLRCRGLMVIPAPAADSEGRRRPLSAARALFERLAPQFGWDTLSMGMSADLAEAVEEGSTQVRVGSAIFGHRTYPAGHGSVSPA